MSSAGKRPDIQVQKPTVTAPPSYKRSTSSSTTPTKKYSTSTSTSNSSSSVVRGETFISPPAPPVNPKPIRENAKKGLKDALKNRMNKAEEGSGVSLNDDKLSNLVEDIESELYRLYNKDVGSKYKNKYRSLVFNLKDEKNNGLFRKVLTRRIGPRSLVAMTAEELASKELQQWRQAELKQDIEKIKAHELDMITRGDKVVIKTHKGDQIIESDSGAGEDGKPKVMEEVKLPDDLPDVEKSKEEKEQKKVRYKMCKTRCSLVDIFK